jgi:hypothetical protein
MGFSWEVSGLFRNFRFGVFSSFISTFLLEG